MKEPKKLKKGKEYDRSGAEKTWHELRGSLVPLKRLVLITCMHQVSFLHHPLQHLCFCAIFAAEAQGSNTMLDLSTHEALSGVTGSISLAAWIFVLVK